MPLARDIYTLHNISDIRMSDPGERRRQYKVRCVSREHNQGADLEGASSASAALLPHPMRATM